MPTWDKKMHKIGISLVSRALLLRAPDVGKINEPIEGISIRGGKSVPVSMVGRPDTIEATSSPRPAEAASADTVVDKPVIQLSNEQRILLLLLLFLGCITFGCLGIIVGGYSPCHWLPT